jgi:hypothetical protein
VRSHAEDSYAAFPDEHKSDLISHLREHDERQRLAALWEPYTFTLFDRLGYTVNVQSELPGSTKNPGKATVAVPTTDSAFFPG